MGMLYNFPMKPLIRWVGGKSKFLEIIKAHFNFEKINRVIEPFAGSGALFFDLEHKNTIVNDLNKDLINFYKWVRDDWSGLYSDTLKIFNSDDSYYSVRDDYNKALKNIRRRTSRINAARFYFLNRKGFNGVYRVNRSGVYNVPKGSETDFISNREDFRMASNILKTAEITSISCLDLIENMIKNNNVRVGDLFYFDPPYFPDSSSKFNGYTDPKFAEKENIELLKKASILKDLGATVIISNSFAPDLIKHIDTSKNLDYVIIPNKRSINPKAIDKQERFKEILIF